MKFPQNEILRSLTSQESGSTRVHIRVSENSTHFILYEVSDLGWGNQKKVGAKFPKSSWTWEEFEKHCHKVAQNLEECHNQFMDIYFISKMRAK